MSVRRSHYRLRSAAREGIEGWVMGAGLPRLRPMVRAMSARRVCLPLANLSITHNSIAQIVAVRERLAVSVR
jgi:hypothetical protein